MPEKHWCKVNWCTNLTGCTICVQKLDQNKKMTIYVFHAMFCHSETYKMLI